MKTPGVKILLVKDPVTGEACVPPAVMDLLKRFGEHRNLCEQCKSSCDRQVINFCATGHALLFELGQQPEVSQMGEGKGPIP